MSSTAATSPIRIAQLSDTHFLEPGDEPEGGVAYDTAVAFDVVRDDLAQHHSLDFVTVTGDIADHGRVGQYAYAAKALQQVDLPVHCCPGNHDQHDALTVALGRSNISVSRAVESGSWCFLFVDSNDGIRLVDDTGRTVDPPLFEDRLHCDGSLGAREAAWVRAMCAATAAEHVFIWLHHPPGCEVPLMYNEPYTAEWIELLDELPKIRGFGGGHTHIPDQWQVAGRPVFVAPSLKNNFDLGAGTMLGPGYRTYVFEPDGTVESTVHVIDDERWPRAPIGRAVTSLFNGEITYDQLRAIAERKRAHEQS